MGMMFSHLLAGFAGFTATVVTPRYSADPSLIFIAILLLLGLILAGVYIAIFQRSISKNAKRAPKQSQPTESEMFQTLEQAIEDGHASLGLDVAASPNPHVEIPSPLAELALQFDNALPEPKTEPKPDANIKSKTEHSQIAQSALNGANGTDGGSGNGFAHQPPNPARAETARVSLPRLSELRGMRFSQALRDLDKAKRSAPANAGPYSLNASLAEGHNDTPADTHNDPLDGALNDPIDDPISEALMSAIAPFEAMFASTASAPPSSNKGRRREDSTRSPSEPKAPEKETNGFIDQLHILPSRRGQYKKKS